MLRVGNDARRRALVAVGLAMLMLALPVPRAAPAAVLTYENDPARTGLYTANDNLSPSLVSSGGFGQLFAAQLPPGNGRAQQIYAQPLVAAPDNDPTHPRVVVATEQNYVYELDRVNGTILHGTQLAPGGELPFDPTNHHLSPVYDCADLVPSVGITSTPAIDTSAAGGRGVIYLVAKLATGAAPDWPAEHRLFELYLDDLSPVAGFASGKLMTGAADNAPGVQFAPAGVGSKYEVQRSALLLLDGVVYAAFAGHCDLGPYRGWILGMRASDGATTARWTAEQASNTYAAPHGGGIWMAGGGLMSDGPGRIFAVTGNAEGSGGSVSTPTPGSSPPPGLGEAAVRLNVQPDGTLAPQDFFTPSDAAALDTANLDFGSGGISAFPDSLGTTAHPHLMAAVGKSGVVYLLDRDNLGGFRQGSGSGNADVAELGPAGAVWGKPAVWPGAGGWMYVPTSSGAGGAGGSLDYYHLSGGTLVAAGETSDAWSFGSGSPIVTQQGASAATALVWAVHKPESGSAELRAYMPTVATGQHPTLVASFPVGTFTKFAPPGVAANRLYVGNAAGQVYGFGFPVPQVLRADPGAQDFDFVPIDGPPSTPVTLSFTVTAEGGGTQFEAAGLTSGSSPDFVLGAVQRNGTPIAPGAILAAGDQITVPVTFAPSGSAGQRGGAVSVATSGRAATTVTLAGYAQQTAPLIDHSPASLPFGPVAIGGHSARSATFINLGRTLLHVSRIGLPSGPPFTVSGAPAAGATIPGCTTSAQCQAQGVTLTIDYDPTHASGAGGDATAILLSSDATNDGDPGMGRPRVDTIAITGTADTPPRLVLAPSPLAFGDIKAGSSLIKSFKVSNAGGTPLTISSSKPPAGGVFTPLDPLPEATVIQGHSSRTLRMRFAPAANGSFMSAWSFAGTSSPTQDEHFAGTAGQTKPPVPDAKISKLELRPTRFRPARRGRLVGKRGGSHVSYKLDRGTSVVLTIRRRSRHGHYLTVKKVRWTLTGRAGANSFHLLARTKARALAAGRYQVVLSVLKPSGKPTGQSLTRRFTLLALAHRG